MTIRYDRPVSRSAFLARRLGRAAAILLVLVVLLHRFGPLTTPDFVALVLASAVPAALAVPLALFGLWRLWKVGALGGVAAAKALLYAALPLGLVAFSAFQYMTRPMLYDVSTDPVDPPAWITVPAAKQQWLERPPVTPAMRQAQAGAYPGLTGRRYEGALDRVHQAVLKVAELTGLTVTASRGHELLQPELAPLPQGRDAPATAPAETIPDVGPVPLPRPAPQELAVAEPPEPVGTARVQAETRTLVLGLVFDVMIRLREEAETTLVDIRVSSRYGPHDLGIGDLIAEHYLHELDAELLGVAGD
ncbi:DUF1499 domain-containing protein [Ciceribacter sp. RN22]|uniref:DUF1499 domain-containing protein n=1 Tax=Ciceribacter sp. RN22 TaxID=2954932 RepID=UPI0020935C12|nr:DUF1499 domain-containing protein [Ciceribacter sp. RN22]MCO6177399.1 DUF1499 domain-containing protein [Ciceribacter sp. RN22]